MMISGCDFHPSRQQNGSSNGNPPPSFLFRYADKQRPPARHFLIADFRDELHAEAESHTFLIRRVVKKINHIPSKPIFYPAPFVQIERTRRIYLHLFRFAQQSAQFPLESKSALPNLRHRQSHHMVGHKCARPSRWHLRVPHWVPSTLSSSQRWGCRDDRSAGPPPPLPFGVNILESKI